MPYTIYDATVVASQHLLTVLQGLITKAENHPDAASFPSKKLADDMLPFSYQIFAVCALAESEALILKGEKPSGTGEYSGELSTYEEMHARIKEVLAVLQTVDKDEALQVADKVTSVGFARGLGEKDVTAITYSAGVAMPNIFFHTTIAYAILRSGGVQLGKFDYLGPFFMSHIGM